jgi:hypothetical protein
MLITTFNYMKNITSTTHNARGLSVDGIPGTMGDLIIITAFSSDNGVHRIKRWNWDSIVIEKDMEGEKS